MIFSFSDIFENKTMRNYITLFCVLLGGFLQAAIIQIFMYPMNLLSSGFTGLAILIEKITSTYFGFSFSTSLGMLVLNVPVAILCSKSISKRFVFFSLIEVFTASFFLKVLNFQSIFTDPLLNITFGGFAYGLMTSIVLNSNASTGGTDFLALYISNKIGKSIWVGVFLFNAIIIFIFGFMFGWEKAGFSILFQFMSTKVLDSFYHRYNRMTLVITTSKPKEVISEYVEHYRHGITRIDGVGGYSGKEVSLLHTVVSSYEVQDIVKLLKNVDEKVIINSFKSDNFYGRFYIKPID